MMNDMYQKFGISERIISLAEEVQADLKKQFEEADKIAEYNQLKVIKAMQDANVGEASLTGTTGYGFNDVGRDTLEKVYSYVFHTEDALVRPQITSGTHALNVALSGNLRPGDILFSPVGKPYDTLEQIIGIRPSRGSLKEYGVDYVQTDFKEDMSVDYDGISKVLEDDKDKRIRLVTIQRSKGYAIRRTLSVKEIGEIIAFIKERRPDINCMVDNCYGEFTETIEPSDVGADMVVGSLIKNPGGGLAPEGGYIAGKSELIENAACRLGSPGLGKELGASLGVLPSFYQGFFLAPTVVASAVKGAVFAAGLYEKIKELTGFELETLPKSDMKRHDIIQIIIFHKPEILQAFCEGIQHSSAVDSFVTPEPSRTPGYESKIIMAAGAFVSGSSIELSADGPLREPYAVFSQGGMTWQHAKFGYMMTVQNMINKKIFEL